MNGGVELCVGCRTPDTGSRAFLTGPGPKPYTRSATPVARLVVEQAGRPGFEGELRTPPPTQEGGGADREYLTPAFLGKRRGIILSLGCCIKGIVAQRCEAKQSKEPSPTALRPDGMAVVRPGNPYMFSPVWDQNVGAAAKSARAEGGLGGVRRSREGGGTRDE